MSPSALQPRALEEALAVSARWIEDLGDRLGWRERRNVLPAMIAALHGLRDAIDREEAIALGACLPTLLRGFYYEGWRPSARLSPTRAHLLERIHEAVHREPGIDPEQVARAVFALLAERLPGPELEEAKAFTPDELRSLWPD